MIPFRGIPILVASQDTAPPSPESSRLRDLLREYRVRAGARVLREFAGFAGSRANAANLLTGLAWGVPIALASPPRDGRARDPFTFTAPTGRLRNYDIYVCLALARRQLTMAGIERAAPEHIAAALVGVLALRSRGMTWAAIAAAQAAALLGRRESPGYR